MRNGGMAFGWASGGIGGIGWNGADWWQNARKSVGLKRCGATVAFDAPAAMLPLLLTPLAYPDLPLLLSASALLSSLFSSSWRWFLRKLLQ